MHPEAAVLQFFRTFEADLASGSVRNADDYAAEIPEHAERIREEYRRLTEDPPASGERWLGGRYRLVESLGRGSFGEVFLARDSKMRRSVAIKVLDEFRALSAEWRERLVREAEATQRIAGDGCCTVHDVGFEAGVPFLVMPWIQGQSLDRIFSTSAALGRSPVWVRDGLGPGQALPTFVGLIEAVARTLHEAHEGGVIHRDIKPANVLVRPGGRPVLIDFGLAWLDDADGQATRSASFGTPAYSAPEVRAGSLDRPDPRVDVWSLGVVLYEGLVGARPFSFSPGRSSSSALPRRVEGRYGRDMQAVIEAALAPDPAHRYQDMKAFADDLARIQSGESVSVRPAGRVRRAAVWVRSRPLAVGLSALALAFVGAGLTALVYAREQSVIESAVVAIAASVDELADGLTERGKLGMTIENRLEDARSTHEIARRLSRRFGSSPAIDRSLSRILVVLAETEILVGDMELAEVRLREAVMLLDRMEAAGRLPGRQDLERRSHALILIGDTMTRNGRLTDAHALFTEALAIDEKLLKSRPNDPKCASDVGFGYLRIGSCEQMLGKPQKSLEMAERALGMLLHAESLDPANPARKLHVAEAQRSIAYWSNAPDTVSEYVTGALDRQEAWVAAYPADGNGWRQLMLTAVFGLRSDMPADLRARSDAIAERGVREILARAANVPIDVGAAGTAQIRRAEHRVATRAPEEIRQLVEQGMELGSRALALGPNELPVQRASMGILASAALVHDRLGDAERANELRAEVMARSKAQFEASAGREGALLYYVELLIGLDTRPARDEARRVLAEHRERQVEFSDRLEVVEAELLADDR